MNADQIRLLEFRNLPNPDMCYRTLRRLSGNGNGKRKKTPKLKRDRESFSEPYFYWSAESKRPDQIQHRLGVNWFYVWMNYWADRTSTTLSFRSEPKEYEPDVRPDMFAVLKSETKYHIFFGEFHRQESGNKFEKIPKYVNLFERISRDKMNGIRPYWWVDPSIDQRIPTLIIITTGSKKPILDHIKKENTLGIPVELYTLTELKERCLAWQKQ